MDNLKSEAAAQLHKHSQEGIQGNSKIYEIKLILLFW